MKISMKEGFSDRFCLPNLGNGGKLKACLIMSEKQSFVLTNKIKKFKLNWSYKESFRSIFNFSLYIFKK